MESNTIYTKLSKLTHGRGYVYCLQYHIVWCTKYRKPVLTGNIEASFKTLIHQLADEQAIHIAAMETMPDHVHLLIETKPQCRISDAVKIFKGTSAWHLFREYPELKRRLWGGHLWNPSYFAATVSDKTAEQVSAYIEGQKTAPGKAGRPKHKR